MFQRSEIHRQFKAFSKGDEPAFAYFNKRYRVRIYYFVLPKVKDKAVAKELRDKAFEALFVNYWQIETVDHLLAFLYHFARKCSSRYLVGRPCTNDGSDWQVPPAEDLVDLLEDDPEIVLHESEAELQTRIGTLSTRRKEVVEMRLYLRMSVAAIAVELNIAKQTVRNHLSKSKSILEAELGGNLYLFTDLWT